MCLKSGKCGCKGGAVHSDESTVAGAGTSCSARVFAESSLQKLPQYQFWEPILRGVRGVFQ